MGVEPALEPRREPDHLREVLEAIASDPELVDADMETETELVHCEERVAPVLAILGAVLLIAIVHAFDGFSRPPEVIAPRRVEQNMRAMLALAVQEIEQSREHEGVYPRRIAVADIPGDNSWRYERLTPGRYQLILVLGELEVSFDSEVDSAPIVPEIGSELGGQP